MPLSIMTSQWRQSMRCATNLVSTTSRAQHPGRSIHWPHTHAHAHAHTTHTHYWVERLVCRPGFAGLPYFSLYNYRCVIRPAGRPGWYDRVGWNISPGLVITRPTVILDAIEYFELTKHTPYLAITTCGSGLMWGNAGYSRRSKRGKL